MGDFARQVMVSCEHASNRLPPELELDAELLRLHIAWDPGALPIARYLAGRFDAVLLQGRYSRLVADLNRTIGNSVLMRKVSDGHPIPFNRGLTDAQRQARIDAYYRPYREAVIATADRLIHEHGRCVHICVHTFTPALAGRVRGNDIGLLHDPRWGIERAVCADLRAWLDANTSLTTWFNRPYSGTADGILPALRARYDPDTFVGIELEINQKYAPDRPAVRRIARQLGNAFAKSETLRRG